MLFHACNLILRAILFFTSFHLYRKDTLGMKLAYMTKATSYFVLHSLRHFLASRFDAFFLVGLLLSNSGRRRSGYRDKVKVKELEMVFRFYNTQKKIDQDLAGNVRSLLQEL